MPGFARSDWTAGQEATHSQEEFMAAGPNKVQSTAIPKVVEKPKAGKKTESFELGVEELEQRIAPTRPPD